MYLGRIKFFDSKVNNFGFIYNISPKEIEDDKIYFNRKDVICDVNLLINDQEVVFEIKEFKNRKRAVNVNLLTNLSMEEKKELSLLLEGKILQLFVLDLLKKGINYSREEKNVIFNKLITSPILSYPYYVFDILTIFNEPSYLSKFNDCLIKVDDLTKLEFLRYRKDLLVLIANNWLFEDENTTQILLNIIKGNSLSPASYPKFILTFNNKLHQLTANTIIHFYSVFYSINGIDNLFSTIKDIQAYLTIRNLIIKHFSDNKQRELLVMLSNYIFDNYLLFEESLNDSHKLDLLTFAKKDKIELLLSNWEANNLFSNYKLLDEIKNRTKYFEFRKILNKILKKILDAEDIKHFSEEIPF